ncbi:MAG TPA: thioredoxin-disulfide reductase [Clostridiales bacterium]|jgi:thioredoxin reductase (NADPH)|nr:thioredoxin-disulfide reductase [Clostridiales bacterium]
MTDLIDIAIIGGGAAGLAAGLYSAQGGMKTVIFEGIIPGGKLGSITHLTNYPGFSNGTDGFTLAMEMEKQAKKAGAVILNEKVTSLVLEGETKQIITNSNKYYAKSIIITAGAAPKPAGFANENDFIGRGVSYCALCDGALYKNKRAAVIGGGNTAISDAIYLSRFAEKVYVIHRRSEFRAIETLMENIHTKTNVEFILDSVVTKAMGDEFLSSIEVLNKVTNESTTIEVDGVFVAVGIMPNTEFVKAAGVKLTDEGYIITDELMRTDIKGVFAAGDIRNTPLRQVVTAVADGAIAADSAMQYVRTELNA